MRDPTKEPDYVEPPETWGPYEFLCNYSQYEPGCLKVKPQTEMAPESGYSAYDRDFGRCLDCVERAWQEAEDQKNQNINRRAAVEHSKSVWSWDD